MVYQRQVYKQQQSNVAVDASKERRYFEGVQGDKQHQGELFGLSNMFALADEEITRMQSLVNRERRSAAEYAYEIKSAAEIEAAARAKAEADKKDNADDVTREGPAAAVESERGSAEGAAGGYRGGVWRRASGGSSGGGGRGGDPSRDAEAETRVQRRRIIAEEQREEEDDGTRGDARRMFTRGEDRVVHEHRHDNIVGDDGPGGRETARSRRAVAVARRQGFDAGAEQRERDEAAIAASKAFEERAAERAAEEATRARERAAEEAIRASAQDEVLAAMADFEKTSTTDLARRLTSLDAAGRTKATRAFIAATEGARR